jgi:hypothetical protein
MTTKRVRRQDSRVLHLRLYTGQRNFEYKASLRQLHGVLENFEASYELEVLDGKEFRDLAMEDEAPFIPLLVRISPLPMVRLSMPQATKDDLQRALFS